MPGNNSSQPEFWIGAGWKMTKTLAEAREFAQTLLAADKPADRRIQRFVLPPFTLLREVGELLADSDVLVGAQNLHWDDAGAWTGEISAPMLVDRGITLVEIGHSERRTHFGETDKTVGLKVAAALRHGLTPLVCVGETSDQVAQADAVLAAQVDATLAEVPRSAPVLFACEPVWAIGTSGVPADPGYANQRICAIKSAAAQHFGDPPRCLYGGSVDAGNCTDLMGQPMIDGLFIGRAAWRAEEYLDILRRCGAAI